MQVLLCFPYQTRGEVHQNRTSRGHPRPRCLPNLPPRQGKDCSPPSEPSPHAGDRAELSGKAPRGQPSPQSTTSCTAWTPRRFQGKCLVSCWGGVLRKTRIRAAHLSSRLETFHLEAFLSHSPGDIIDNVGLKQQVATWQQILCDEVLVWPDSHAVTHTQRAKYIQDLVYRLENVKKILIVHIYFFQNSRILSF